MLLRWGLQSDCVVIPKSVHLQRIQEATWQELGGWQLGSRHMEELNGLEDGYKFCWDPSDVA